MNLLSADELEARLRDIGTRRYHNLHPFHRMLHGGKCSKGQVQAWALNRYYYQAMIPLKDAGLIARCEDPAVRREWRSRLVDHDGTAEGEGGIARWLKLTGGLGLDPDYVISTRGIRPNGVSSGCASSRVPVVRPANTSFPLNAVGVTFPRATSTRE